MDTHWQLVKELVADALELPAAERPAFLDARCAGDAALRQEVEELLAASAEDSALFEAGAAALLDTDCGLPDAKPEAHLARGVRIGPFTIEDHLGEGGFADVYRARQSEPIEREVALKRLKPGMDSRSILQRFDAERRTLGRLQHQHIARVLDAGADDQGRPWVAMDLVRGQPLTDHVRTTCASVARRIELFLQTCDAVEHAHRRGVLHRDLKPSNVLVDASTEDSPRVQVIDFGIARLLDDEDTREQPTLTAAGMFVGTPAYASPEQLAGERDLDTRVDVYALGVMLYELLTGSRPGTAEDGRVPLHERVRRLRQTTVERPSSRVLSATDEATTVTRISPRELRGELDWITLRALEPDRERRYQSVAALADDLRRAQNGEPVEAGPPSATYRLRRFAGRHRALVAGIAFALLAVLAGGALATVGFVRARDARLDAEREARRADDARLDAEREARRADDARREALALADREADAKDEALAAGAESDAVSEFLANLLYAPLPDELGREVTVIEVLDGARAQLDRLEHDTDIVGIARARVEARIRHVLGTSYVQLGDFDSADEHLVRADELARELFGPTDETRLRILASLARLRSRQTRNDEATRLIAEFERHAGATFSPDDAYVRTLLLEFRATSQFENGDNAAARKSFEELLAFERATGQTRESITTLGNLAQCCTKQNDIAAALDYGEQAWTLGRDEFGVTHPVTIIAGRSYGMALLRSDPARASEILRASAEASIDRFGPDHFRTLGIQNYEAFAMQVTGDLEGAEKLYAEVLPRIQQTLGSNSRQALMASHNLGMVQLSLDRPDQAAATLTDALAAFREARGAEHLETLFCEVHLLNARSESEGPVDVDASYVDAIGRWAAACPERHPLFGETFRDFGQHLLTLSQARDQLAKQAAQAGDSEASEKHIDGVIDALERALAAFRRGQSKRERRALAWLVEATRAYGRTEAAARWKLELDAYDSRGK